MEAGAKNLLRRFLDALDRLRGERDSETVGKEIWQILVGDAWYQAQLRRCAWHALHVRSAPLEWLDEVQQEAVIILARTLKRRPDLNLRRELASKTFEPWFRTILTRDCLEAIRKLIRERRRFKPLDSRDWKRSARHSRDDLALRDERVDVSMALERLPRAERLALSLYAKGYTIAELAGQLHVSKATAQRRVQRGLRVLQQLLRRGGYS